MFVNLSILIIILYISIICTYWNRLKRYNQKPLQVSTFDKKNSPYHPTVIFFPKKWKSYNFYMAETPFFCGYPQKGDMYRDRFECPSIHVSNDGIHWTETCQNPIDNLSDSEITNKDYFSDPHLVFTNNGLECWYRINHRYGDYEKEYNVLLLRKISKDGINWGEREIISDLTKSNNPLGNMIISPAIIYNQKYHMWYVDSISHSQRNIAYSSWDTNKWETKKNCKLIGREINPWHIDVSYLDNTFWLVIFDRINLTLWKSSDGLNFSFIKELLAPSKRIGSFYSNDLYRACLVKIENKYRLYFSADDTLKTYIGVMEGLYPDKLKILSPDNQKHQNLLSFIFVFTQIMCKRSIVHTKRAIYLYIKKPIMNLINKK